MKYDTKIKTLIRKINFESECYLEDVKLFNECASTDRIIESIVETAQELKKIHEKRFNNVSKKDTKKLKNVER